MLRFQYWVELHLEYEFLWILTILFTVNKWIANRIANATKNMMEQKDERYIKIFLNYLFMRMTLQDEFILLSDVEF